VIPLDDHYGLVHGFGPDREDLIFQHIENMVSTNQIDKEIQHNSIRNQPYALGNCKVSDYVRFLTRNSTFTTLSATRTALPNDPYTLNTLRELWDVEDQIAHLDENAGTFDGRYLAALRAVSSTSPL